MKIKFVVVVINLIVSVIFQVVLPIVVVVVDTFTEEVAPVSGESPSALSILAVVFCIVLIFTKVLYFLFLFLKSKNVLKLKDYLDLWCSKYLSWVFCINLMAIMVLGFGLFLDWQYQTGCNNNFFASLFFCVIVTVGSTPAQVASWSLHLVIGIGILFSYGFDWVVMIAFEVLKQRYQKSYTKLSDEGDDEEDDDDDDKTGKSDESSMSEGEEGKSKPLKDKPKFEIDVPDYNITTIGI